MVILNLITHTHNGSIFFQFRFNFFKAKKKGVSTEPNHLKLNRE